MTTVLALCNAINNATADVVVGEMGTTIPCGAWVKIVRLARELSDAEAATPASASEGERERDIDTLIEYALAVMLPSLLPFSRHEVATAIRQNLMPHIAAEMAALRREHAFAKLAGQDLYDGLAQALGYNGPVDGDALTEHAAALRRQVGEAEEWRVQCREEAKRQVRRLGFLPSEETTNPNQVLQYVWRTQTCRRDPSEILWAIIDALTQEGVTAWPGDATSCVEQMMRVQYDRAEEAERRVREAEGTLSRIKALTDDPGSISRDKTDALWRVVVAIHDEVTDALVLLQTTE